MRPPFGLVFVHGDGSRVVRFNVPRWVGYATLVVPGAVAAVVASLVGARAVIEGQRGRVLGLERHVTAQSEVIDGLHRGVATVRAELSAWRSLHASMWEAVGPEPPNGVDGAGVGGASVPAPQPAAREPSDELRLLLATVAEEGPRLRELQRIVTRTGEVVDALPLRWPLRGRVTSEFGRRASPWSGTAEHHGGMDIGSPPGTLVLCPADGDVVAAGWGRDLGRHVVIEHQAGVRSIYGHLGRIEVRAGQRVAKGDVLGIVGSSGRSTGPHLHYEVRVDGRAVDPRRFLRARAHDLR
jgi:hypothetical protein